MTQMRVGRPTLEEVATKAGVSRATVSRVVNGSSTVDPKLAKRVNAAIADLRYVPNQAARSLMTRQTNVVALVAAEEEERVFGDPFFSGITRGVSQELLGAGRQLMLFMLQDDHDLAKVEAYLLGGHCDGVLLISEHGHQGTASVLAQAGIPVVLGGRPLDPRVHVPYVDNDNVGGAVLATHHLRVTAGRRRVATIAGPQDMAAGLDRLVGFTRALGPEFDAGLVEFGDFTTASGSVAMQRLLDRAPDLDGVFVASDLMAISALHVLRRSGRRVPEDVAVVGFDDIPLASETTPTLTTVRQPTIEQGRRMARALVHVMTQTHEQGAAQPRPEGIVLPVELVIRESA